MTDLTNDSDRILAQGRALVRDNRDGGRHRRASIGSGSAKMKTRHLMKKVKRIIMAVGAIIVAAMSAGVILNGIGFAGIMLTGLAIIVAMGVLANYPKITVPKRADINKGDVQSMVGKTELWLEHQRPALPPPAAKIVEDMGVQLDALGLQLQAVDQQHPAAREVRKLVGEVLPETVDSYRKIPQHLRGEARGGATRTSRSRKALARSARKSIASPGNWPMALWTIWRCAPVTSNTGMAKARTPRHLLLCLERTPDAHGNSALATPRRSSPPPARREPRHR